MGAGVARARELARLITDELIKVLGLRPELGSRLLFGLLAGVPTGRFARLAAQFDQRVAAVGFREACRWALPRFVREVQVFVQDSIPCEGPLLVAANHPGTVDSLAIAASLPRHDLRVVASGLPFLRGLPAARPHLICAGSDPHQRMGVVRESVRHLRRGGALLIFPSGNVDPDPAVLPGAEAALDTWSPSLGLMLRSVPETRVLPAIISGVLAPGFLRNPLARRRATPRERQKVAEFLQTVQQMVLPRTLALRARLTFGRPLRLHELAAGNDAAQLTQAVVDAARRLLADHLGAGAPPARGEFAP